MLDGKLLLLAVLATVGLPCFGDAQKCDCSHSRTKPLIINGLDAPPKRFPYACSLRSILTEIHFCGCVLIDKQHVLTAAHCVDDAMDQTDSKPLVVIGLHEINQQSKPAERFTLAERPIIHPQWNGLLVEGNDIAILKLNGETKLTPIGLPAPGTKYKDSEQFVAIGFGDIDIEAGIQLAVKLQVLRNVLYISPAACSRFPEYLGGLTSNQFCGQAVVGRTQEGDSGSPMIIAHRALELEKGKPGLDQLVGLTSYGPQATESGSPEVYTRVSPFRLWIDCVIDGGDNDDCSRRSGTETSRTAADGTGKNKISEPPLNTDSDCWLRLGTDKSLAGRSTTCLGIVASSPLRCVFWNTTGRIDCFYRGVDTNANRMTMKDGKIESVVNIGGKPLDEVECVIIGPRMISCFIIEASTGLMVRNLVRGKWGPWKTLGHQLRAAPRCISPEKEHIHCIGVEPYGGITHRMKVPGELDWRFPISTGCSSPILNPRVIINSYGDVEIFFSDSDNDAYTQEFGLDIEEWSRCLDSLYHYQTEPSIVLWSNETIRISRQNSYLYAFTWSRPKDRYYSFPDITGNVLSRVECVSAKDFTIDCFALDFERVLIHATLRQRQWSRWERITGPFMEAPVCLVDSNKKIRCYLRGYTQAIAEVVFTP